MKKLIIALWSVATLAFGEPMDRTGPYVAIGGGYALFDDDSRMEAEPSGIAPSYNLNIIGGAFINRYLSVEIAFDYYDTFVNDENDNKTKLYIADVAAKAHYPFWDNRIDLYGAFGAGQVYWSEYLDALSEESTAGVLRGDVGVGYRTLDWLTLNVGLRRYFFTLDKKDQTGTVTDQYFMDLSSAYVNIEVQF